jgi:hypothetical protein
MLRSHLRSASIVAFLTLGIALIGTSCQNRAGDCAETLTCGTGGGNDGTGGETTDTGGSAPEGGMGGQGGLGGLGGLGGQGTGGTIEPCDPTQEECVGEVIVHVSPAGDDGADGSLDAPVQTVAQALTLVAEAVEAGEVAPLVYLCATGDAYEETLTLRPEHGAVGVYGGFDCDGFAASDQRAVVIAADANGHSIEGATGVTLGDLHLESPSATGNQGASSYGLRVIESTGIRILRSDIVAGEGAPGADGMGYEATTRAEPGAEGNPGTDACVVGGGPANEGGDPAVTTCGGSATESIGGEGGPGGLLSFPGGDGAEGEPDGGTLGDGEDGDLCTGGGNGSTGTHGSHGPMSEALGTLSADGYAPPVGGNGLSGGVGEGGGGGGGAAKPATCDTGASGGSGGGGGCPGAGASGGQGGGGSFGLLVLSSQAQLSEVDIAVAIGGEGGDGGDGQLGGTPGQGAEGGVPGLSLSNPACRGGNGGFGGTGGSGAGGSGGPSIGIAYIGDAPVGLAEVTATLPDDGAPGGPGGTLNDAGEGPTGLVQASWAP